MSYQIRNLPLLKKILWADFILGGSTAIIGLVLFNVLAHFLGLPRHLIIVIAAITLAYALVALRLATQTIPPVQLVVILVYANWVWTIISVGFLIFHLFHATIFGDLFLILQILVVGLLAYLEGRHLYTYKP